MTRTYIFTADPALFRLSINGPLNLLMRYGWIITGNQSVREAIAAANASPLGSVLVVDKDTMLVIGAVTTSAAAAIKCKKKRSSDMDKCKAHCDIVLANCPVADRRAILAPDGCHCFCGDNGPEVPEKEVTELLYP